MAGQPALHSNYALCFGLLQKLKEYRLFEGAHLCIGKKVVKIRHRFTQDVHFLSWAKPYDCYVTGNTTTGFLTSDTNC